VRITIGRLLAGVLLTLCVGLQALEATGRWDQTLQDTGDETVVVAIVLCIGSALLAADLRRVHFSLQRSRSPVFFLRPALLACLAATPLDATAASPPLSLRI
jgi:hypothetical protein